MGPTASGKTKLAIELCKYLPFKIISVDSCLIYKYMNIGTGKLNINKQKKYPHFLIDMLDPKERYSVYSFRKNVLLKIKKILKDGYIPLLVGGTMLYYKSLLKNFSPLPSSNVYIQKNILKFINNNNQKLHSYLNIFDSSSSKKIHKNDHRRLLRALEVYYISGKKFSELLKLSKKKFPYSIIQFAILPKNKSWLYKRVVLRFKKMISLGFQKEVEFLFNRGDLHKNLPSIKCIGYKQMWKYLSNEVTFLEMFNNTINETMQLAKKQMTWLRNWKNIYWLKSGNINKSIKKIISVKYILKC
ncbi:tRNA (adenosine(37)-N6)-dimethylallyltransferase MiaA [Buchnera aphidicola]|uniref:tRNA (adenosine(37)-N6)-dimethylallyltransferase MiaA n=1 Tax=Buchnera aphidicola TaxID=9 RepID=UPI0031B88F54